MRKMLYIANEGSIKSQSFYLSSFLAAKRIGVEFHLAFNAKDFNKHDVEHLAENGVFFHQIEFSRKPYSLKNLKAYKQLLELCKMERFDAIHCNTPVGGFFGRIVGSKCKISSIIYQAHGFHFYKGAPLINWLVYYPIEKWLAHKTDILITINNEDYNLAKNKMHLKKGGRVEYVPGVGIDAAQYKYNLMVRNKKREELGFSSSDIILISAGELIKRKNYKTAIDAVILAKNPRIHYLICGEGPLKDKLMNYCQQRNMEKHIHFLGFTTNVKDLMLASDIFVLSSVQEGLARCLMEAMASKLPCVVSDIRGNNDLIKQNVGGFLCNPKDYRDFCNKITLLSTDYHMREEMGASNADIVDSVFSINSVVSYLKAIYSMN